MEELRFDKERYNAVGTKKLSPLARAFWEYTTHSYSGSALTDLHNVLKKEYGKNVWDLDSEDAFLTKHVRRAIAELSDDRYADEIAQILCLRRGTQFSDSSLRRSFRSEDFGFYAMGHLSRIAKLLRNYYYEGDLIDLLPYTEQLPYVEDRIALAIRHDDQRVIVRIRDMILGEKNTLLERRVILGVILSGNEELLSLLIDLLLAAKNQEGVRQAILESADAGSLETFLKIFQVCIANDLFRFSSGLRALYTWTGIYLESSQLTLGRTIALKAWDCLTDEKKRQEMMKSQNPFDAYLALWSIGCYEVLDVDRCTRELLDNDLPYRRSLAWHFVSQIENAGYRHKMAVSHLEESDEGVLASLIPLLHSNSDACFYSLSRIYSHTQDSDNPVHERPDEILPARKKERLELFSRLKAVVLRIGKEKKTFAGNPFPWSQSVLSNEDTQPIRCMISLAAVDLDPDMIRELYDDLSAYMSVNARQALLGNLIDPNRSAEQKEFTYRALKDRSIETKRIAIRKLADCLASGEDVRRVCELLTSKSADLKKDAVSYLKGLSSERRKEAVTCLIAGSDAQVQAAMELLLQDKELAEQCIDLIRSVDEKKLTAEARLLHSQLIGEDTTAEELSPENGYGLYHSSELDQLVLTLSGDPALTFYEEKRFSFKKQTGAIRYLSKKEIEEIMPSADLIREIFGGLARVFSLHRDYEITEIDAEGSRTHSLLGDAVYRIPIPEEYGFVPRGEEKFDMYPFAEEFQAVLQPLIDDPLRLVGFLAANGAHVSDEDYQDPWLNALRSLARRIGEVERSESWFAHRSIMSNLIRKSVTLCEKHALFDAAFRYYYSMVYYLGDGYRSYLQTKRGRYYKAYPSDDSMLQEAGALLEVIEWDEADFRTWILTEYRYRRPMGFHCGKILIDNFLRAVDLKILPIEAFYEWILHPERNETHEITKITSPGTIYSKPLMQKYPWLYEAGKRMSDHMVRFELRRGQAETPISMKVLKIGEIVGGEYFDLLLRALGKDNFFRGYSWYSSGTKPSVLSCLLRKCIPDPEDTAESIKRLLCGSGIPEKRLVEAAMYAPQWAPIIEELIGWQGLKKGIWFFHAHCSDRFGADKETEVAIYSPISAQEFNDGAFDIDWFREAYSELGEKRFSMLYKAAKYITDGSNAHRRSQLYADAVTEKFEVDEMEAEITEKRNQEKLRAYALIPLDRNDPDRDLLRRYEYIQNYRRESRQFGALRRESERKACDVALSNLALTCGLRDVDRMLWKVEAMKDAEIAPLLIPAMIEGYEAALVIDEEGKPFVNVKKDGKVLKTMPKSLAKDAYIETLKQAAKDLKNQRTRGKRILEQSMIKQTWFEKEEIENILSSRTIHSMAEKLLWINEKGKIGFIKPVGVDDSMTDSAVPTIVGEKLRIAHSHDLSKSGNWEKFIHFAFEQKLVQPFRQIFREYYPLTSEEREEVTCSRRYAGYQVQPRKTMGVLKSCGWTVDYEEGLQKVSYAADLVVRLYSNADWFSPSDIEAPTLEEIRFFKRRSWEAVPLTKIDPILYSEVMRDIDLAVSTAYVGGVDPEASHSTVEMRAVIAKELIGLLKVSNVTFTDHHARITGKLGTYSVHLGSGIVHAAGVGMIPILPVHSQHRGRIFLPFADEDPKTAEIMAKVLLLSEDTKIRDPEILKYLK